MSKKFNVSNPSGFPEFTLSEEQVRREWVAIIEDIFQRHGFTFMSTPLVEREENLLGKGGEAKEMYVLKRLLDHDDDNTHSGNALRFDHTVPLGLYVARHFNELNFPFRRAVIGPNFRGERAQKGRYRQFDQCDIDIVGNESLSVASDAQIVAVMVEVFSALEIGDFVMRMNHRKVLLGYFEKIGVDMEKLPVALKIVDDLEKLSREKIVENFGEEGISSDRAEKILDFVNFTGDTQKVLEFLISEKTDSDSVFNEGVDDLETLVKVLQAMNVNEDCYKLDLKIARGLDYYTGMVFEGQIVDHPKFGSVCGGGRYEDLAQMFTGKFLPAVGVAIGFTRLLRQCLDAGIVKVGKASPTEILVVAADDVSFAPALFVGQQLREMGLYVENFVEKKKLAKKFAYADKQQISYVIVVGENESREDKVMVKNLVEGSQELVDVESLGSYFLGE